MSLIRTSLSCLFAIFAMLQMSGISYAQGIGVIKRIPPAPSTIKDVGPLKFQPSQAHLGLISKTTDEPHIEVISIKDTPWLVKSGNTFNLARMTITFTPQGDFGYRWKKEKLDWVDDYGELWDRIDMGKVYRGEFKKLPFAFPFYDYEHDEISLLWGSGILFRNKNQKTADKTSINVLYDYASSPMISAIGGGLSLLGDIFYKENHDSVMITFIGRPRVENSFGIAEVQIILKKSGVIKISYGNVESRALDNFMVGLNAGRGEEIQLMDFNNLNSGESRAADHPVGLIWDNDPVSFDNQKLLKHIEFLHPDRSYDAVVVVNDFTHLNKSVNAEGIGGTLGAVMTIHFNDTIGTGYPPTDCEKNNCEELSKAKALIKLNDIYQFDRNYDNEDGKFYELLLHEFGHKWMAFTNYEEPRNPCAGGDLANKSCHWVVNYSAAHDPACHSSLYGMSVSPYIRDCIGYSHLDLYLMGLESKSQAKEQIGSAIDRIVERYGERSPSYKNSQKIFNLLMVFATKKTVQDFMNEDKEKLDMIREYTKRFPKVFAKVTMSRGMIVFDVAKKDAPKCDNPTPIGCYKSLDANETLWMILNGMYNKDVSANIRELYNALPKIALDNVCRTVRCDFTRPPDHETAILLLEEIDRLPTSAIDQWHNKLLKNRSTLIRG
ncbi:MAG TPA: hypothetical protein PKU96_02240, partial [bacterium]|nr:hypothetical protein [bacterium]